MTPGLQTTTTQTGLVTPPKGAWGAENARPKDLLIPRIALLSPASDLVKKDKGTAGTLVDSVSGTVLAQKGKSVEVIPIMTFAEWEHVDTSESQPKTIARERITADNEGAPETFTNELGESLKRQRCLNFFVLIPSVQMNFPYLLQFRKSSLHTGKKLSTHFQLSAMNSVPPASQAFNLGCVLSQWESYTFYVFTLDNSRPTTSDELQKAYFWYTQLQKSEPKVDEGMFE